MAAEPAPSYFYRVYGLELVSDVPIPELTPGGDGSDAAIRSARVEYRPARESRIYVVDGAIFARYPRVGTFLIDTGEAVLMDLVPVVDQLALRLLLTGPMLGLLLHQRGSLVLHGSTICIRGVAVGFLGDPGTGKSTTAGAFHAHGYPVVGDDLLPVGLNGHSTLVHPGFPQLKLWPQAAQAFGADAALLPRLHPAFEKRAHSVDDSFQRGAVALERLYLLEDGPVPEIEDVPSARAVVEILRNTYVAPVPALAETERMFEQCSELAGRVPVRRLRRPRTLSELPTLISLVEADVRER